MDRVCDVVECMCESSGCGCKCKNKSPNSRWISVLVTPTTGGQLDLSVPKSYSIENLKKLISKKLKVAKERICLLYRERQLREGTVEDNQLVDGSRLTLLPSVETGLLAQRPEQSVMQALESLNDSQVNDFLSGKAPLNLTMRLGDHMMLIQLQLSTVAPAASSSTSSTTSTTSITTASTSRRSAASRVGPTNCDCTVMPAPSPSPSPSQSSITPPCQVDGGGGGTSGGESGGCSVGAVGGNGGCQLGCRCECSGGGSGGGSGSGGSSGGGGANSCSTLLDTRALAEASRNLTQTLKQLSSEVLTSKSEHSSHDGGVGRRQGAIIESMHHHGKGVYSGTFSGTLNPALQDKFGRPKRDISTIIHILNDLLCATPQYRAVTSISPSTSSTSASSSSRSNPYQGLRSECGGLRSGMSRGGGCEDVIESSTGTGTGTGGSTSGGSAVNVGSATSASSSSTGESISSSSLITNSIVTSPPHSRLLPNNSERERRSISTGGGGMGECVGGGAEESLENRATRGKMERLRLVLGQRRERRRAMRARPYASPTSANSTAPHPAPPPAPDSVTA